MAVFTPKNISPSSGDDGLFASNLEKSGFNKSAFEESRLKLILIGATAQRQLKT